MSLYLDASVLVPLLREEPDCDRVRTFLSATTEPLMVSDFAAGEVGSAFGRLARMGEITGESAHRRLQIFDEWIAAAAEQIETDAADVRLAARLVRRFALGLRPPDAIHIAAAQLRGLTLVTLDRPLLSAAEELGLPAIAPR